MVPAPASHPNSNTQRPVPSFILFGAADRIRTFDLCLQRKECCSPASKHLLSGAQTMINCEPSPGLVLPEMDQARSHLRRALPPAGGSGVSTHPGIKLEYRRTVGFVFTNHDRTMCGR